MANLHLEKPAIVEWNASTSFNLKRLRGWIIIPALCLIVAGLGILELSQVTFSATINWSEQQALFLYLNESLSKLPEYFWANITLLGDASVLLALMSLILIKHPAAWRAVCFSAPLTGVIIFSLKSMFDTPRPAAVLDPSTFTIVGNILQGTNSFPSGHTATAFMCVFSAICFLIPKPQSMKHYVIIAMCLMVCVLVGLSRIAVGAHWPLDVLVGSGLGMLCAIVGGFYASKNLLGFKASELIITLLKILPACLSSVMVFRIIDNNANEIVLYLAVLFGYLASSVYVLERMNINTMLAGGKS